MPYIKQTSKQRKAIERANIRYFFTGGTYNAGRNVAKRELRSLLKDRK